MITIKNELIALVSETTSYLTLSEYPDTDILPVAIVRETANASVFKENDYIEQSSVVYEIEMYDKNLSNLKSNTLKLDDVMLNKNFTRSFYEEANNKEIHAIKVSYRGILELDQSNKNLIKIYKNIY